MEKQTGSLEQETKKIKQIAVEAKNRGIIFDIGHGTDSFNFQSCRNRLSPRDKSADTITQTSIFVIVKTVQSTIWPQQWKNCGLSDIRGKKSSKR